MRLLFVLVVLVSASSCSHAVMISEREDVWVDDRSALNLFGGVTYYCRANKDNKGMAAPICYKAKYLAPKDE